MLTFLLSRGVPTQKYSTYGVSEFDQARALTQAGCKVVFFGAGPALGAQGTQMGIFLL